MDFLASLRFSCAPSGLLHERVACPQCGKSQMYFCCDCLCSLPGVSLPQVELPMQVDIVHHVKEKRSKSSAVQAAVLAPAHVRFIEYTPGDVPTLRPSRMPASLSESSEYSAAGDIQCSDSTSKSDWQCDPATTLLLYPGDDAADVSTIAHRCTAVPGETRDAVGHESDGAGVGVSSATDAGVDVRSIERLVVIDSTWTQSRQVLLHPMLSALPRVKLQVHKTAFWRPNTGRRTVAACDGQSDEGIDDESCGTTDTNNNGNSGKSEIAKRKASDIGPEGLATVEAIYFFFRELSEAKAESADGEVDKKLDDLLLLFALQFEKVQQRKQASDATEAQKDNTEVAEQSPKLETEVQQPPQAAQPKAETQPEPKPEPNVELPSAQQPPQPPPQQQPPQQQQQQQPTLQQQQQQQLQQRGKPLLDFEIDNALQENAETIMQLMERQEAARNEGGPRGHRVDEHRREIDRLQKKLKRGVTILMEASEEAKRLKKHYDEADALRRQQRQEAEAARQAREQELAELEAVKQKEREEAEAAQVEAAKKMVADNQKQMTGLIEILAQQQKPGEGETKSKAEGDVKSEAANVASDVAVMETKVEPKPAFAPESAPDSAPAPAPAPASENATVAENGSVAAMDETDSV